MKMLKRIGRNIYVLSSLQPLPYHHTQTTQSNQYNDNNNAITTHHNEKVTIQNFEIMKHWNECYYGDDDEAVYEQIEDDILNQQSSTSAISRRTRKRTPRRYSRKNRRFIKG
mmetsp:Transcript_2879/g.3956  ORF Transcript_2879/g.3956 Transcript_2879/m.3956 type:complete len:112 (+) Transcript_2879:201-536(+)